MIPIKLSTPGHELFFYPLRHDLAILEPSRLLLEMERAYIWFAYWSTRGCVLDDFVTMSVIFYDSCLHITEKEVDQTVLTFLNRVGEYHFIIGSC